MKWCEIKNDIVITSLFSETVAMFMREKVFNDYENAKFINLKRNEKRYVILYNEDEVVNEFVTLNPKDMLEIDFESVENEINYLKSISTETFRQLNGESGMDVLSWLFDTKFSKNKRRPMGSYNGRGGLILESEDDRWRIEINLNFLDLYEISVFENNKLLDKSEQMVYTEMFDYIGDFAKKHLFKKQ